MSRSGSDKRSAVILDIVGIGEGSGICHFAAQDERTWPCPSPLAHAAWGKPLFPGQDFLHTTHGFQVWIFDLISRDRT